MTPRLNESHGKLFIFRERMCMLQLPSLPLTQKETMVENNETKRSVEVLTIEENSAGDIITTGHMEIILTPRYIVRRIYALAHTIHKGLYLNANYL